MSAKTGSDWHNILQIRYFSRSAHKIYWNAIKKKMKIFRFLANLIQYDPQSDNPVVSGYLPGMSNLASKLVQISAVRQNVLESDLKKIPDLCHLGPIWVNLDAKFDTPDCSSCCVHICCLVTVGLLFSSYTSHTGLWNYHTAI